MAIVSIQLVTCNSEKFIKKCLESVYKQTYKNFDIVVIDNNSQDNTVNILQSFSQSIKIIKNNTNIGFAPAHNIGFKNSDSKYVLILNPDIVLNNNFIEELIKAMEKDHSIGMVSGKLFRMEPDGTKTNIIDSTGLQVFKNRRFIDRGQGQEDKGQHNEEEFIFGVNGAAPIYKRKMLEDISINGEIFDESYFAYKEDVDLSWRAQLLGWKCLYTPKAVAYHLRGWSPEKRKKIPSFLRIHSLKNRYLTLIKNDSLINILMDLPFILWYEIKVFGYLIFREPTTLKGYFDLLRLLPEVLKKRKIIQSKRKTSHKEIRKWFK